MVPAPAAVMALNTLRVPVSALPSSIVVSSCFAKRPVICPEHAKKVAFHAVPPIVMVPVTPIRPPSAFRGMKAAASAPL